MSDTTAGTSRTVWRAFRAYFHYHPTDERLCHSMEAAALGRFRGTWLRAAWPALDARMARALGWIGDHPDLSILAMRFLWGLRAALPVALGMSRVSWARFFGLNLASAAVWVGVSVRFSRAMRPSSIVMSTNFSPSSFSWCCSRTVRAAGANAPGRIHCSHETPASAATP